MPKIYRRAGYWCVSARGHHAYARAWYRVPLVLWRLILNPSDYIEGV